MSEAAPQRDYPLREVFNGQRYIVRGGISWRMMPNDLPPWYTVINSPNAGLQASVFEAMVHDLRALLRLAVGCQHRLIMGSFGILMKTKHFITVEVTKGSLGRERKKGLHFLAFAILMAPRFVFCL